MSTPAHVERRVRDSFSRQRFMATIGARLTRVGEGEAVIEMPVRPEVTQQHGFVHAGVVAALADSACGYAALSLMDSDAAVLSVEFKVNLLAPAAGDRLTATGTVVKAGRTLTVCRGEVTAQRGAESVAVAVMQATMMSVRDRAGLSD
ncbi:MAG TPA: PaaI family thioesterase [Gemmatimonadaceae bacterium]|nr:PaaI family thioesterase [Gemmatimonadaceae bacterium]